ncbi:sigma-54 interaction domain-containing protein [Megalodesulfovibrio paquesii]
MSSPEALAGNSFPLPPHPLLADVPETLIEGMDLIICSPAMQATHRVAVQVAASDAPVLIQGESGTGKELFARLIHGHSGRSAKPYVAVNCGVLKGELFADKFFGHEAGAFTGAHRLQKGSFELAEDGSLFLDEVGEIPPENQVDFLRVLEERRYKRLGGEKLLPFKARIIAATNRDLTDMVRRGEFRADLFYRLNVIPIVLPPLRMRREEIPPLATFFLERFCHRYHKRDLAFAEETMVRLTAHHWPGNVRELKNLVERLVLLASGGKILPDDLPLDMDATHALGDQQPPPACLSLDAAVREAELRAIRRALHATKGRKAEAARLLQISDRALRYKMREHGM